MKFLDFSTHRQKDENGFLIVKDNPIAKAGVFEYLKSEILPNSQDDEVVKVFRPFDTLLKIKDSFANKPIKSDHEWVGADGAHQADGAIGSEITIDEPNGFLKADLIIYNPKLIELIENGKVELSPAYTGEVKAQNGRFEGQDYDYLQEVGCINHLAVVDKGRSGADLRILDTKQNLLERTKMAKKTFLDGLTKHIQKFLDNEGAEPQDEVKTTDSVENLAKSLLEIAKGEADESEKIAKIIELLSVKDEESKTCDNESETKDEESKTCDNESETKDEETKTQDDDSESEEEKISAFADSISALIDSKLKAFKDSIASDSKKIQDSYAEVSKALGQGFDYAGKSESEIYKIGYETLTNSELSQGVDAKSAFKTALSLRVPKFADSSIKTQDDSSKIDELLSKMKG